MPARIRDAGTNSKVLADTQNHLSAFESGIGRALYYVGDISAKELRRLILDPPATGRIYRRPGGRIHQASAPGEAPADDTGRLRRSVDYAVTGIEQVEFGEDTPYAQVLEFGGGNIAPRPHVRRAADNVSRQAIQALGRIVAERLGVK